MLTADIPGEWEGLFFQDHWDPLGLVAWVCEVDPVLTTEGDWAVCPSMLPACLWEGSTKDEVNGEGNVNLEGSVLVMGSDLNRVIIYLFR